MITNEAKALGGGWLPAGRSEQAQIVPVGHAWQPGQEIPQVGEFTNRFKAVLARRPP